MNKIDERFALARKELLDLSLKNPLINYKLRAATGLEFPSCNCSDIFTYLVNDGKNISFTYELTNNPSRLYVDKDEKEVHSRLLKTYRSSKLFLEEKGANTLFLALGFLKWSDNDETFYRAPLILVPIELNKQESTDKFSIKYSGEEIRLNVSLIKKMQQEYDIDIDYNFEEEMKNIDEYLRFVSDVISKSRFETWEIESSCAAFDFFSYAKFLMYKDLDLSVWLDENGKLNNDVLERLFVTNFDDKLSNDFDDEKELEPQSICNVVDADSSQGAVILDINKGKNMVIQGPPGTGKSQTITNIIASSIAQNKSILFVSEKKAALDVVKRRLEKVGLGDLVLELHSSKTNKNDVLKSLEATLALGEPKNINDNQLVSHYEDIRNELNRYKNLMNKKIGKSDLSLIDVYGNALKLKERIDDENIKIQRVSIPEIETWSYEEFNRRLEIINEYQSLIATIGKVEKHPYFGVTLSDLLPYEQVSIKEKLSDIDDALALLITTINEIGNVFNYKATNTIFDSKRLINSIDAVVHYGGIAKINCVDSYFVTNERDLNLAIAEARYFQSCPLCKTSFKEDLDADALNYTSNFGTYSHLGLFKKKDAKYLKENIHKLAEKYSYRSLKDLNKDMSNYMVVKQEEKRFKHLFKNLYTDLFVTDWNEIEKYLVPTREYLNMIEDYKIISQTKNIIGDEEKSNHLLDLEQSYFERKKLFEDKLYEFFDLSKFDYEKRFDYSSWYQDLPFGELKKTISSWKSNVDSIVEVVRYNDLNEKINKLGIRALQDYYAESGRFEYLDVMLSYEYFDALINRAYEDYPLLSNFREYKMERVIDIFKDLDIKMQVENIRNILKIHYDSMPKINDDTKEMNIVRRELQKKKNKMPIRKLFMKSGSTIQKIKPVFMMSPISVASYLPPKQMIFDLVVFDEASQVRPVEAFGALLRAKQIVVVGDSKQLPPTTFFDSLSSKYDDVNDEDYDITNMESILSLLLARNIPQRTLNWHYRSKNQSLIMVSNNEFYSHSLKVFPSVFDLDPNKGLIFRYLPDSVYDRGGKRTNRIEAKEVIKAVFDHAVNYPNLSLGVASFSLAQQEELYKEFSDQMKLNKDPRVKAFFQAHQDEPFFIKNLESVQGDERDAIFISVGYGYDANRTITMDFGPLNKDGGERRLNVLISRAKVKCIVFSNITSHDINLSKTSAQGVIALKRFLDYAQNRIIYRSNAKEVEMDKVSDYLNSRLTDYGYEVDTTIGKEVGIDLAVYDKELKRFSVGIECDGGAYGELNNVTDRERIRRNMLKSLGWKVYHVWSPDFYRNPKNEFEKILDFIQEAKESEMDTTIEGYGEINISRYAQKEKLDNEMEVEPYQTYTGIKRRSIIYNDEESLKKLMMKIIEVESPLPIIILKKRLMAVTELVHLSEKQDLAVTRSLSLIDNIEIKNDFIFLKDKPIIMRNRSLVDKNFKKMEYISEEEIRAGIITVINSGNGSTKDEVIRVVIDNLGFNRSNTIKTKISDIIDTMIKEGKLYIDDNAIYIND